MRRYGTGPGAVRFISGTWAPHVALEAAARRASTGARPAMLFSSAYATVMGILPPLITPRDRGDQRRAQPQLHHQRDRAGAAGGQAHLPPPRPGAPGAQPRPRPPQTAPRAIVVTDGVFSMRGDHAPLDKIMKLAVGLRRALRRERRSWSSTTRTASARFGATGRGTEEVTRLRRRRPAGRHARQGLRRQRRLCRRPARSIIDYLRETSPFYIYSNPITPGGGRGRARRRRPRRQPRTGARCSRICAP